MLRFATEECISVRILWIASIIRALIQRIRLQKLLRTVRLMKETTSAALISWRLCARSRGQRF